MMALCDEFGPDPRRPRRRRRRVRADTFYFDGQVVAAATLAAEFTPLATRMATAAALEDRPERVHAARQPVDPGVARPATACLPASALIRRILERAYVGEYGLEVDEQSVWNLLWLIDYDTPDPFRIYGDSDERYHIHEGNDALPVGAGRACSRSIALGHELVAVRRASDGRPVWCSTPRRRGRATTVDRVVFALPFTLLRRLDLTAPGSPPASRRSSARSATAPTPS
jgi:monoamine oxidase